MPSGGRGDELMGKIPWGGIAFIAALSSFAGLLSGTPLWLFAAYLAVWTGLCFVIGWIGGEFRKPDK